MQIINNYRQRQSQQRFCKSFKQNSRKNMTMIENEHQPESTIDNPMICKDSSSSSSTINSKTSLSSQFCYQQQYRHRGGSGHPIGYPGQISQSETNQIAVLFSNGDASSTTTASSCNSSRVGDDDDEQDDEDVEKGLSSTSSLSEVRQTSLNLVSFGNDYCNNQQIMRHNSNSNDAATAAAATTTMLMTMMQTMPFLFPQLVTPSLPPVPVVQPTPISPIATLAPLSMAQSSTSFNNLISMGSNHFPIRSNHHQYHSQTHPHPHNLTMHPTSPVSHSRHQASHSINSINQISTPSINFSIDSILHRNSSPVHQQPPRSQSSLSPSTNSPNVSSLNNNMFNIPGNVRNGGLENSANIHRPRFIANQQDQQFYNWFQCARFNNHQQQNIQNHHLSSNDNVKSMLDNKQRHLSPPSVSQSSMQFTNSNVATTTSLIITGTSTSETSTESVSPGHIQSNATKRKPLNRGPRIPFTTNQVSELEAKFNATQYLSSLEVNQLARRLNLTDTRIRIWFQNRRAREKREQKPQSSLSLSSTSMTNIDNNIINEQQDQTNDDDNGDCEDDGDDNDHDDDADDDDQINHNSSHYHTNYGTNSAKIRKLSNESSNRHYHHQFDVLVNRANQHSANDHTMAQQTMIKCEHVDSNN